MPRRAVAAVSRRGTGQRLPRGLRGFPFFLAFLWSEGNFRFAFKFGCSHRVGGACSRPRAHRAPRFGMTIDLLSGKGRRPSRLVRPAPRRRLATPPRDAQQRVARSAAPAAVGRECGWGVLRAADRTLCAAFATARRLEPLDVVSLPRASDATRKPVLGRRHGLAHGDEGRAGSTAGRAEVLRGRTAHPLQVMPAVFARRREGRPAGLKRSATLVDNPGLVRLVPAARRVPLPDSAPRAAAPLQQKGDGKLPPQLTPKPFPVDASKAPTTSCPAGWAKGAAGL